jgi:hypothetical protein
MLLKQWCAISEKELVLIIDEQHKVNSQWNNDKVVYDAML